MKPQSFFATIGDEITSQESVNGGLLAVRNSTVLLFTKNGIEAHDVLAAVAGNAQATVATVADEETKITTATAVVAVDDEAAVAAAAATAAPTDDDSDNAGDNPDQQKEQTKKEQQQQQQQPKQHRIAEGQWVVCAALSPDQQRIYFVDRSSRRIICMLLSVGLEVLASAAALDWPPIRLLMQPNGTHLVGFTRNGFVVRFDPSTLEERGRIDMGTSMLDIAVSNSHVVVASDDGHCYCCDLRPPSSSSSSPAPSSSPASSRLAASMKRKWSQRVSTPCTSVTINRDGRLVVAGGSDGRIKLFAISDGALLAQLNVGPRAILSVHFVLPRHVLFGDHQGTLSLWNLASKKQLQALKRCGPLLAASEDGTQCVCWSDEAKEARVVALRGTDEDDDDAVFSLWIPSATADDPSRQQQRPCAAAVARAEDDVLVSNLLNMTHVSGIDPAQKAKMIVAQIAESRAKMSLVERSVDTIQDKVDSGVQAAHKLLSSTTDTEKLGLIGLLATLLVLIMFSLTAVPATRRPGDPDGAV